MKAICLIFIFSMLTSIVHAESCDLSANDRAVSELNDVFDRGEISGEDHLIGLKNLHLDRLDLISTCLRTGKKDGITLSELKELKDHINYRASEFVEEINQRIELELAHDRTGMAMMLMLERDQYLEEAEELKKLVAEILRAQET